jgi:acyl carrier protein
MPNRSKGIDSSTRQIKSCGGCIKLNRHIGEVMTTENWNPLTKEQVEKRFIEMINEYLDLHLEYPLPADMSIKDLRLIGNEEIANLPPEIAAIKKSNLEIDSIDILELVIQVEEEFGAQIDDKEIAKLLQWSDLIGYITDSQTPVKK